MSAPPGPSASNRAMNDWPVAGEARFVTGLTLILASGSMLPLEWGWVLPLVLLGSLTVALGRTGSGDGGQPGLWAQTLHGPGLRRKGALVMLALACFCLTVLCSVAARAIAGLLLAFPASAWGLLAALAFAGILVLLRRRLRAITMRPSHTVPLALVGALVAGGAAWGGAAFEATGSHARGWAQSGPVHGIHPFQTTAIIIDGYGPFDLPFNDYVEPTGSRGYAPEALADALERALHRIAVVHFADGPARARKAFAEARVEMQMLPVVRERLDREPPSAADESRLLVWSGTTGRGSSVEFVCPGRREDPRPYAGESIQQKLCPTKYASEASAGLGVTGRWPGYAEGRGTSRASLFNASSADLRAVRRGLAVGVVVVLVVALALSLGTRVAAACTSVASGSGVLLLCGWLVAVVATSLSGGPWTGVDPWPRAAFSALGESIGAPRAIVASFLPLIALASGLWACWRASATSPTAVRKASDLRVPRWDGAVLAMSLWIVLVTIWSLRHRDTLVWIDPWSAPALDPWFGARATVVGGVVLPFERLASGLAEVAARVGGDVEIAEAIVAALLSTLLLGFIVASLHGVATGWGQLRLTHETSPRQASGAPQDGLGVRQRAMLILSVLLMAAASGLAFSRATGGAIGLFPGALALTLVLQTSLRRRRGRGWLLIHALAVCVAVGGLLRSVALVEADHPFSWIYLGLGALILAASAWPSPRRA